MKNAGLRVICVLNVALCALLTSFNAKSADTSGSQEGAQVLEEVVVTAQRREEDINRVPISISVYSQTDLQMLNIKSVGDVAAIAPGVDFRPVGDRNWIAIRGISQNAGGSTAGLGPDTTAIYVDEAPIQSRFGQAAVNNSIPLVFDIDHIEVLRGPQGTVFGASAEGGAIRVISHAPSLTEYSGFARMEGSQIDGGGFNTEMGIAYGGPIVADKLGFRVSAWSSHDGGYINNDPSQRPNDNNAANPQNPWPVVGGLVASNVNKADKYSTRAALTWQPTNAVSVEAAFYYQKKDQNSLDLFDPTAGNPDHGDFVSTRGLIQPVYDTFYTPSLNVDFNLGWGHLTSVTTYLRRESTTGYDYTTVLPPAFGWTLPTTMAYPEPVILGMSQNNFTQEIRLQSPNATDRFRWTVGLYYSELGQNDHQTAAGPTFEELTFINTGQTVQQYFGSPLVGGIYTYVSDQHYTDKYKAVFASADFDISAHFSIFGGARYEKQNSDYLTVSDGPLAGGFSSAPASYSSSIVAPKGGLNWKLNDQSLLYVSAAKGYRAGGANVPVFLPVPACIAQLAALGNPTGYKPDYLWSYEIGAKHASADRRLSMDGSVFYIDWTNIISGVDIPACATHIASNLGKAKSTGFDFSMDAVVTSNVNVGLHVAYTDARYASTSTLFGETISRSGQAISDIPPWNLNATIEYHVPLAHSKVGYAFLEDQYDSRNNMIVPSQDPTTAGYDPYKTTDPAVNQLNVRFGLRWTGGMDIALFATNLLNSHPLLNRYDGLVNDTSGAFTIRPLTTGVSLLYHW